MSRAILPGSYDPVTVGHLDLIRRAAERYDEVYAVIFRNPEKTYRFSLDDRVKMLILATDDLPNALVSYSDGLVIDYMRESGIDTIVKGYRSEKDLAYERVQAEWNELHGGVKTELLPASPMLSEVSSTAVREMLDRIAEKAAKAAAPSAVAEEDEAALRRLVPPAVADFLLRKIKLN